MLENQPGQKHRQQQPQVKAESINAGGNLVCHYLHCQQQIRCQASTLLSILGVCWLADSPELGTQFIARKCGSIILSVVLLQA